MRETEFQEKCLTLVKERHWGRLLAVNFHGGGATNKGFPDLVVFGRDKAVAFELKGDSGYKLQADQQVWRNRFLRVGTPHYVVIDDVEEFESLLEKEFFHETSAT